MAKTINLNADIAEGWGAYDIGNDAELMKIIKSASVACGFHAGDPNTMHRLCMLAKQEGVSVGVHPGFKKRFVRVNITHAGNNALVEQDGLETTAGARQAGAPVAGIEIERLRAKSTLVEKPIQFRARGKKRDAAEATDVAETQLLVALEQEQDVRVTLACLPRRDHDVPRGRDLPP